MLGWRPSTAETLRPMESRHAPPSASRRLPAPGTLQASREAWQQARNGPALLPGVSSVTLAILLLPPMGVEALGTVPARAERG